MRRARLYTGGLRNRILICEYGSLPSYALFDDNSPDEDDFEIWQRQVRHRIPVRKCMCFLSQNIKLTGCEGTLSDESVRNEEMARDPPADSKRIPNSE